MKSSWFKPLILGDIFISKASIKLKLTITKKNAFNLLTNQMSN